MRKIFFYILMMSLLIIQIFITFLLNSYESYPLKLINYDEKIHRYILFPKAITFKPLTINQLIKKFEKTHYNFIYYLDWNYFQVSDSKLFLKLIV